MIEHEIICPFPPDATWEFLIKENHMSQWWGPHFTLEPRYRGRVFLPWVDSIGEKRVTTGVITAIDANRRLQMDFFSPEWPKKMRDEFLLTSTPDKNNTRVYLQHSGWEAITEEAERKKKFNTHAQLWAEALKRLEQYTQTLKENTSWPAP